MVERIYVGILEKDFPFEKVNFESWDCHAYYFDAEHEGTPVDIKVIIDSEVLEVWYRETGREDWLYVDTFC